MTAHETVFTMEATPITFGPGASREAGWELQRLGVRRALVVSDPGIVRAGITERIIAAIEAAGIACVLFDRVRVEPTLASLQDAADAARDSGADGIVGVGGGSSLDTAKAANLIATHPAPLLDYVNPPIGGGRTPPSPLKPMLAIPTTAGTGSEATTVAVLDLPDRRVKTGISHRYLRPSRGLVDPEVTASLPAQVAAASGLDVVCHAAESYTARPYDTRPAPPTPADRPPYQGANPISDMWSARALQDGGRYLRRAVAHSDDREARGATMLAATLAGIGFGSAGVHIPHACAYPIAGLRRVYRPAGYAVDHPLVPHGFSVVVTAPAAFRFTYPADPQKHRHAAELLAGRPFPEADETTLPDVLIALMKDVGAPRGLAELGYDEGDIDALVAGALQQQRLLALAPRDVDGDTLAGIFRDSLYNW